MPGVGLGQLLLALDATLVSLVDAPRGLDLPVGSAALIDSDDVRLGLAAAAGSADVFFLLGRRRRRGAARGWTSRHASACAGGDLRQGAVERTGGQGGRGRVGGGGRGTAGPLGAALPVGQPRLGASRGPRRPGGRLGHRSVRLGAVARRPHPRHGQHRKRPVARAGLFGLQRRSRRAAPPVHPGPRRAARASGVDRPMGHLRCAAGRRRGGARRRASGVGSAPAAGDRDPSAAGRRAATAGVRRHHLGAARLAAPGRRRRGDVAGCGGTGRPDHVSAGGPAVHACAAGAATARASRTDQAPPTWPPSPANSASPPTATPR